MQTDLPVDFLATPDGAEADRILRTCVHCGFCNATCPTFLVEGNELDGPRGRIYLIKEMLEGGTPTATTRQHLDRCLTCRGCETTCPSGVDYGALLTIGRRELAARAPRPLAARLGRWGLRRLLAGRVIFPTLYTLGRLVRPFTPISLRNRIPQFRAPGARPTRDHARRILMLRGCVQKAVSPATNAAAARLLDRLGIMTLELQDSCCGAIDAHLEDEARARARMRRNIDLWWPEIDAGAEAILVTASGCGVTLREYGDYLKDDPDYAEKARTIAALARDPVEILAAEDLSRLTIKQSLRIAFQSPCTLTHGLGLRETTETLLTRLGFTLVPVADGHLCCGSAGTYSILERERSLKLRDAKLMALEAAAPDVIATANIGCGLHLAAGTDIPVRHWLEIVDDALS